MNEYLDFAKGQARDAGKIMKRYFMAQDIGKSWKEDDTPLTIADTKINSNVIEAIKKKYPEHGVLAEEESYKPKRELIWVMDPVDGTIPFSSAIPVSTFSLALVDRKDGQPLVGVVLDPFLNRLYSAVKDGGAHLNSAKIEVSSQKTLRKGCVSVLGFRTSLEIGTCIDKLHNEGAVCFSLVSQAYSAALIGSGEFIGSIFGYGAPWDNAAASLIVREAGGVVTGLDGKIRRYDDWGDGGLLACNQEIHDQLVKIVKNANSRD